MFQDFGFSFAILRKCCGHGEERKRTGSESHEYLQVYPFCRLLKEIGTYRRTRRGNGLSTKKEKKEVKLSNLVLPSVTSCYSGYRKMLPEEDRLCPFASFCVYPLFDFRDASSSVHNVLYQVILIKEKK